MILSIVSPEFTVRRGFLSESSGVSEDDSVSIEISSAMVDEL